jgi:hypothetical protein
MNNDNEFLAWGDSFIAEESNFTLLPAGEYPFTVTNFERKIYDGNSDKIPNGAPFAEIQMEFKGAEGTTTVTDRLYLMKKWQWKLTQFFESIGQAPVIGQPFNPNWNGVIGSHGTAKLAINKYTSNKSGKEVSNNQVNEYLKPAKNAGTVQNFQQPNQNQQQGFSQPNQNFQQNNQQGFQQPNQNFNGQFQ